MAQPSPILPALAVDAACSGNPGVLEFRGVVADTGTEVFRRGPFMQGTNNIGEFLAWEFRRFVPARVLALE